MTSYDPISLEKLIILNVLKRLR